jgi:hypothetical protein
MSQFLKPLGVCFLFDGELPAPILSNILCRIVNFLQDVAPYTKLQHYEDWWEHDDLHFHRGALDFNVLYSLISSPRNLLAATPADDYVFVGVAPADNSWYLRFRVVWDDEGFNLAGSCAIVLPLSLVEQFRKEVLLNLSTKAEEKDAALYYREVIS